MSARVWIRRTSKKLCGGRRTSTTATWPGRVCTAMSSDSLMMILRRVVRAGAGGPPCRRGLHPSDIVHPDRKRLAGRVSGRGPGAGQKVASGIGESAGTEEPRTTSVGVMALA